MPALLSDALRRLSGHWVPLSAQVSNMASVRSLCLARPCGSQQGLPVLPFQDVMPPQMHLLQPSTCRQCIECWLLLQSATSPPPSRSICAQPICSNTPVHITTLCAAAVHTGAAHIKLSSSSLALGISCPTSTLKMLLPDTVLCPYAVRHRQSRRHQGELLHP